MKRTWRVRRAKRIAGVCLFFGRISKSPIMFNPPGKPRFADEVVSRILDAEDVGEVLRNIRNASTGSGELESGIAAREEKETAQKSEIIGLMSPSMSPGSKLAGAGELRRRLRGERGEEERVKDVLDVGREFVGGNALGRGGGGGGMQQMKVVSPKGKGGREGGGGVEEAGDKFVGIERGYGTAVPGKIMQGRPLGLMDKVKGKVFGHQLSPSRERGWGERRR